MHAEKMSMKNTWMTDKPGKFRKKIDVFSALASVTSVWHVVGTFPMCFPDSGIMKKCRFSKIIMVYQIVLLLMCLVFISTAICKWEHILRSQNLVMKMVIIIRTLSCVLSILINCVMWIIHRKDFIDAIDFLASQSLILHQLGCRLDYTICLKMIKALVYGTLTILCLLKSYDFIITFSTWPSGAKIISFLQWFFWNLSMTVQVISPTIFDSLVMILGLHFRQLNIKLMAVRDRNNSSSLQIIEMSDECAESVRLIAKVHYNLSKISKLINSLFSGMLVVIVVTPFFVMSSSLYFIFNEIVTEGETDYLFIGSLISWQITTALPITVTVIICNWTANEAAHTGKLIHEIHIECSESKIYQIIRSLSLQLHHQKIEFSGAGLFPINSSLLQTMIGNMTTFLVILIQFQPSLDYT